MNINYGKHYIDNIDREEAVKVLIHLEKTKSQLKTISFILDSMSKQQILKQQISMLSIMSRRPIHVEMISLNH